MAGVLRGHFELRKWTRVEIDLKDAIRSLIMRAVDDHALKHFLSLVRVVQALRGAELLDEAELFEQILLTDYELPRLQNDGIVGEFVAEAGHN